MYRVCSFAAGQLISDAQAKAYTYDQQCGYELQFVDLRYRNTTVEKLASISIKGIASHWN